jgi:hypothetical protein
MRSPSTLVFATLAIGGAYFQGDLSINPRTRYDQTVAIVAHGELHIDRFVHNTTDWSRHGDHYYPNKPPGLSLLAVAPYFVLHRVERMFGVSAEDPASRAWRANHSALAVLLNGLLVALAGVFLRRLLLRLGAGEVAAVLGALAWGLATPVLSYAGGLWSHPHVAALLVIALCLSSAERPTPRTTAGAGALCGLAALSEYLAVVPAVGLAAYVAARRRSARDVATFVLGGAPFLAVMLLYHAHCFGSPWATGQTYLNPAFSAPGMHVEAPLGVRLVHLTVSPWRGLFFYVPVLLLAGPGVAHLWRTGRRDLALLCSLVPLAMVLALAPLPVWYGGGNMCGPRYLIPAMSFLGVPAALAFPAWPRVSAVLGGASFMNALAMAAYDVTHRQGDHNPLFNYIYPGLAHGGYPNDNLGKLLGLPGALSLIPLVILWAIALSALRRSIASRPEATP